MYEKGVSLALVAIFSPNKAISDKDCGTFHS